MLGLNEAVSALSAATWGAACLYGVSTSITPGPNNVMLLNSGVNFGVRRSLPHLLGVNQGLLFVLLCSGAGIQALFTLYPWLASVLQIVGSLYLLYLAYQIWQIPVDPSSLNGAPQKLMGYWQAVAFQFVNPKVWVMVVGYYSALIPPNAGGSVVVLMCLLFMAANLPSIALWLVAGARLRRYLAAPKRRRWFNRVMAALLVCSLILALSPE